MGGHTVVLSDFTHFNGLAEAARVHLQGASSSGKPAADRFEFADIVWGWKGEKELFPVPNGKNCVDLDGRHIAALMQTRARRLGRTAE